MYCIFLGTLNNLCTLNKQYGLSKASNEAMFVIEAYCTLRDRGPMPAHQVLKDLEGDFGFVIYDHKAGVVFAASVSQVHHGKNTIVYHYYAMFLEILVICVVSISEK